MGDISVRRLEDDVLRELKAQAARHGVSMEEEVRQILREALIKQEGLGDAALRMFGPENGFDLELPEREIYDPKPIFE